MLCSTLAYLSCALSVCWCRGSIILAHYTPLGGGALGSTSLVRDVPWRAPGGAETAAGTFDPTTAAQWTFDTHTLGTYDLTQREVLAST